MDPLKVTPPPQEARLHFLDYWRIIRIRKTVILAVFTLVVITATLVTFVLPPSYSSTARIKVERDQSDIPSFLQNQMVPGMYDPYFIQTEFEVIQSERILGKVITNLNLREIWGQKYANGEKLTVMEAMNGLKSRMSLRPVRNTILIEIQVYSEDAEEAMKIANATAEAYKEYRTEAREKLTAGGIEALLLERETNAHAVAAAQTKVDRLRKELNIPDSMVSEYAPAPLLTAETMRRLEEQRIQSQVEFIRQDTLYKHLLSLPKDKLAQALPTAANDTWLGSLLEQKTLADQRLLAIQKDYGPENAEYKTARSQVADLQEKVDKRVDGIMIGLEARVSSLAQALTNLVNEVTNAINADIDKANTSQPYFSAKRDLEQHQRFLQVLENKILSEKVDQRLPKTGTVTIMDYAQKALKPVRPNKPLNIALGIIIGLVVGIGLAFFIEYLDTSVKTIDDVERSLQAPVLGVIPQNVGLMLEEGGESPHAEAYRVLRTNLLFSRKDDKLNSVAIVSAGAGEGKSTTVFNLASVFAQSGQRVLMVDSDLRRPTLHKMLRLGNSVGLTNYLLKQNTLEEVIQTTSNPCLDFLASGKLPSSSLGILSSLRMKELINELKQRYEFIFLDSPPIMGVSDASILASEVDLTLQVIQYRRYPQPMNIRAKQLIEKVGGNLVGIVLNNINMSQDESYYYYSGYYHDYYYYRRSEEAEPTPTEAPAGKGGKDQDAGGEKPKLDIKSKY